MVLEKLSKAMGPALAGEEGEGAGEEEGEEEEAGDISTVHGAASQGMSPVSPAETRDAVSAFSRHM